MSQGKAFEQFHAYRRGWRDATKSWIKDPAWTGHEKDYIREAYDMGFAAHGAAFGCALNSWARVIGYDTQLAIIDR